MTTMVMPSATRPTIFAMLSDAPQSHACASRAVASDSLHDGAICRQQLSTRSAMTQLLRTDLFLPEPEPRAVRFTIISVDDHVVEPPHLFEGRLPAALQDRAPHIIETSRGHQVWEFEGQRYTQVGMNAVAGRRPESVRLEPFRFDQMRPGCYDV